MQQAAARQYAHLRDTEPALFGDEEGGAAWIREVGFGRTVALYDRSSALYQIH